MLVISKHNKTVFMHLLALSNKKKITVQQSIVCCICAFLTETKNATSDATQCCCVRWQQCLKMNIHMHPTHSDMFFHQVWEWIHPCICTRRNLQHSQTPAHSRGSHQHRDPVLREKSGGKWQRERSSSFIIRGLFPQQWLVFLPQIICVQSSMISLQPLSVYTQ